MGRKLAWGILKMGGIWIWEDWFKGRKLAWRILKMGGLSQGEKLAENYKDGGISDCE
jgi:hypothetical protein